MGRFVFTAVTHHPVICPSSVIRLHLTKLLIRRDTRAMEVGYAAGLRTTATQPKFQRFAACWMEWRLLSASLMVSRAMFRSVLVSRRRMGQRLAYHAHSHAGKQCRMLVAILYDVETGKMFPDAPPG
ncbi:MAG: hypothetical protein H6669_05410 [Ardenticatenaceae bacterium]|nr:hypothetical protein [Ardenticatenaceae bacterium]